MMKRIAFAFFAAILLALSTTACNTVRGAGEDVQSAGKAIQNTAD